MPFPGQSWPLNYKVACSFHALATISGIFRLAYRYFISRIGWDDAWALLALLTDVVCLICALVQKSVPQTPTHTDIILNWPTTTTLTTVPWLARMSMIVAIIRIKDSRAFIQRASYAIAISFGLMWFAILVQKLYAFGMQLRSFSHYVVISQLITDLISDILLVIMPIFFLKGIKLSRNQRVLLFSSFASSICITILSIAHSVLLFAPISGKTLLFAHVKAALSVVICNLLVIVTFAYRIYRQMDVDATGTSEPIQFTTIISEQLYCTCPKSYCIHCISSA